jgi:phosphoribosylamine-glycine ligase
LLPRRRAGRCPNVWGSRVPIFGGASIEFVLASAGYPDAPAGPERIEGLDQAADGGAIVFHAATRAADDGTGWETAGGRVLTVVGRGEDLAAASEVTERAASLIGWAGMQRRRDIGWSAGGGSVGAASAASAAPAGAAS